MTAMIRVLVPGPASLAIAESIVQLRADLADAAIEWVLADREVTPAHGRFDAATRPPMGADPAVASRVAGAFLDATKREHDAAERWKACARKLVEALERNPIP